MRDTTTAIRQASPGFVHFLMSTMSLNTLVTGFAAFFIMFGGTFPYIPQYLEIKKTRNAEGFSTFVCLVLLLANTLRIMFWFGKQFELPLLLQSIFMNLTMFAMLQLCTEVKAKSEIISSKQRSFKDFDPNYFWKWSNFMSYVQFMGVVTAAAGATTYLLIDISLYVETLGFVSLLIEAMLGTPQFYKNFQNKSTKGMSIPMVLLWLLGDVFKTVYFLVRHAPAQFWTCGFMQISIDLAILAQVGYYGSKPSVQ